MADDNTKVPVSKVRVPDSFVGKYMMSASAMSFGAFLDMYRAYQQSMNDWARAQQEMTRVQVDFVKDAAQHAHDATVAEANTMMFQGIGAMGGAITGMVGIAGGIMTHFKTKIARNKNNHMDAMNTAVGKASFEQKGAAWIGRAHGAGRVVAGMDPNAAVNNAMNHAHFSPGKKSNINWAQREIKSKAGFVKISEKIGRAREASPGTDMLDLQIDGPRAGNRMTVREIFEFATPKTQKKMLQVFDKKAENALKELNTAHTSAANTVQFVTSIGQMFTAIWQGGFKFGEQHETMQKAEFSQKQQLLQGANEIARKTSDNVSQGAQSSIQGALESFKSIIGLIQNDSIRG